MKSSQIRFVHIKDIEPQYGIDGYTIAYIRSNDFVYFGWSEKCVEDRYEKEIGRVNSVKRLSNIYDVLIDYADMENIAVDFDTMCGVVSINYFTGAFDSIFADQHVADMTMFDFKHSFISSVLKGIIVKQEY